MTLIRQSIVTIPDTRRVEPDPHHGTGFKWAVHDTEYGPVMAYQMEGRDEWYAELMHMFVSTERAALWADMFARPDKS